MSSSAQALVVAKPRAARSQAEREARRKAWLHATFGVVGIGAIALLVRGVGAQALFAILRASARWVPLLVALDTLRVAAEAVATWSLSARVRRVVSVAELVRVHVVGYAIGMNMPAGRATAEAVKAAMLSRHVGVAEAAAIAAGNQTAVILASCVGMIPCLVAALWITGPSALSASFATLVVVMFVGFVVFQLACRKSRLGGALLRRITRFEQSTESFQEALDRIPVVPKVATIAGLFGRAVAAVEMFVLLVALGGRHGLGATLLAQGVNLVGGTLGDLVPGQLGATDGAFALAAPSLGLAVVDGVALSVLLHCAQAFWAVLGFAIPFLWKAAPPSAAAPARLEESA
jgi:hypothetical protein